MLSWNQTSTPLIRSQGNQTLYYFDKDKGSGLGFGKGMFVIVFWTFFQADGHMSRILVATTRAPKGSRTRFFGVCGKKYFQTKVGCFIFTKIWK